MVGPSTVTGKGSASASAQCDPFTGTGSIAGKHAKIDLTVVQLEHPGLFERGVRPGHGDFQRHGQSHRRHGRHQGRQRISQVQRDPGPKGHQRIPERHVQRHPDRETLGFIDAGARYGTPKMEDGMKKVHVTSLGAAFSALVGAAMLVGLGATPGAAQTTTTTTTTGTTTTTQLSTPPIQGAGAHHIVIYVDTVTGGGTPKPLADCLEENQFAQGQLVVFRMWADDSSAGGLAVNGSNAEAAYVTIPGQGRLPMKYASDRGSPSYWETRGAPRAIRLGR